MLRHLVDFFPRLLAVAALAVLGTTGAQAQKIRPGLWEYSIAMKGSAQADAAAAAMARMREEMARMTPEQRAQVEAMMSRQGMGMAGGGGRALAARSCVTPEMAARSEIDMGPAEGRCNTTHSRSGNTLRFKFTCQTDDASTTEGDGEVTLVSDTEVRGKTRTVTTRKGQTYPMEAESQGKWIAADCGDVKPRQQQRK